MLAIVLSLIGWVAFGLVVACWGGWIEHEREVFGNGNGRWLE